MLHPCEIFYPLAFLFITYTLGYRLNKNKNMTHLPPQKTKSLKAAKQAYGTIGKIVSMVESDRYCPEIIQQVDSVIGLLKRTKKELLAGHLNTCIEHQLKADKKKAITELLKIFNLSA